MNRAIWVIPEIIIAVVCSWLSTKVKTSNVAFIVMYVIGLFPLWSLVAKYSKSLFFDAILYDTILVVSYTLAMAYFTHTELKPINIIGIALLFMAVVLIKL